MTFSPGGVFEMDDGENWEYSTRVNQGFVTRQQQLHYALGMDTSDLARDLPGHIHKGSLNDANQRLFYARWAEFMECDNWTDLQNAYTGAPKKSDHAAE